MGASRLLRGVGVACIVYVILRPVSTNQILIPVLVVLGVTAAIGAFLGRRRLAPELLPLIFVQALFGLTGALTGALSNRPGLGAEILVYIAAPVLFWACVLASDERVLRLLFRWAAIATVALSAGIVVFVAGERGLVPHLLPAGLLQQSGAGIDLRTDFTIIRFYGLSSLAAAGPLWIASLLLPADSVLPGWPLRFTAAALATVATLVGGRSAITVVVVLTPLILWICLLLLSGTGRRRSRHGARPIIVGVVAVGAAIILVSSFGVVSMSAVTQPLQDVRSFLVGGNPSDVRSLQAGKLLEGWSDSPLIGQGFGATIHGFVRNPDRPWEFELQYHLLLFQTGAIGILLILAAAAISVMVVRKAARAAPDLTSALAASMTGGLALLIVNASNPYLQAPGHIWWLYVPLAVANVALKRRRSGRDRTPPAAIDRRGSEPAFQSV